MERSHPNFIALPSVHISNGHQVISAGLPSKPHRRSTEIGDIERVSSVNEKENLALQRDDNLERYASRILVFSPERALSRLSAVYMRQWVRWQPGVLFRYGFLGFQACERENYRREIYLGGLTVRQTLFVLVPQSLYEKRRRAVLFQIASERLKTQDPALLRAYCELAEAEKEHLESDHPAWDAEARARQVSYWTMLLSRRREKQTPDWRW